MKYLVLLLLSIVLVLTPGCMTPTQESIIAENNRIAATEQREAAADEREAVLKAQNLALLYQALAVTCAPAMISLPAPDGGAYSIPMQTGMEGACKQGMASVSEMNRTAWERFGTNFVNKTFGSLGSIAPWVAVTKIATDGIKHAGDDNKYSAGGHQSVNTGSGSSNNNITPNNAVSNNTTTTTNTDSFNDSSDNSDNSSWADNSDNSDNSDNRYNYDNDNRTDYKNAPGIMSEDPPVVDAPIPSPF